MARYEGMWAVAGGWAVDLFLGRETRAHADLDIAVLRSEQTRLRRLLNGADVRKAQRGATTPWMPDERLALPTHEIHATWPGGESMEFLLNDVAPETNAWVFRRAPAVRRPLDLVIRTAEGVPYLSPEIVLLYKAKRPQPKDDADLAAALPHIDVEPRSWLASAIETAHGDHRWLTTINRSS